jgi:hypothetical protein
MRGFFQVFVKPFSMFFNMMLRLACIFVGNNDQSLFSWFVKVSIESSNIVLKNKRDDSTENRFHQITKLHWSLPDLKLVEMKQVALFKSKYLVWKSFQQIFCSVGVVLVCQNLVRHRIVQHGAVDFWCSIPLLSDELIHYLYFKNREERELL